MRINTVTFHTYEEAERARAEFPACGTCGGSLKIQGLGQYVYAVLCVRRPNHTRSIGTLDKPQAG